MMGAPIGLIRNISTARTMLDLVVYEDGIVVAKGSLRSAVQSMAAAGVFRAGTVAVESVVGAEVTRPEAERDALLAGDPPAEFLPFASMSALRLKKDWFGNGRLEVVASNGSKRRFDWKKVYDDFGDVEALLRRAAPSLVVRA